MKFALHKYRNQLVGGAAVIAVAAIISTYFAVSGDTGTPVARSSSGGRGSVQFVTGSRASAAHGVEATASQGAKSKASPTPSKDSSSSASLKAVASLSAVPLAGSGSSAASRSPYAWPFSWDSIWNIPIAATATYASADVTSTASYEDSGAADYDSVNPAFPVVTLQDARLASGNIGAVSVHGDPAMAADGSLNTCSAFLGTDNTSVYQGQTTELTAGGNPSFGGALDDASMPVDIEGAGITGCHGGSGLSGLGGTLTLADLTQSGPITHALKVALDGYTNYSAANGGFRWPAVNADVGYDDSASGNYYGGSNSNVQEGSLLALPRSISPSSFSNPTVARLARAMQDYGVYIVDTTATSNYNYSTLIVNYDASTQLVSDLCTKATPCGSPSSNKDIFSSQLDALFQDLQVVTNNTASTPGGGVIGASRCAPYAPQFTGGSDAPPSVTVVNCLRAVAASPAMIRLPDLSDGFTEFRSHHASRRSMTFGLFAMNGDRSDSPELGAHRLEGDHLPFPEPAHVCGVRIGGHEGRRRGLGVELVRVHDEALLGGLGEVVARRQRQLLPERVVSA